MKKERLKEIDALRAIAFIFVVVQHTLGGFSNIEGIPYYSFIIMKLMYVMAKPAVPIFLFISAVALFYVYSNKFNWKSYYIKRIKYVLVPYVIWSAINMLKLGNEDRFEGFIIHVIAGNGAFHLWYMGMVLRVYFIFPLILWKAKIIHSMNVKIRTSVFIVLVCLYYLVSKYQPIITENIGSFIFGSPTEIQQRIISISILFWYLYFVLGIYFAFNYGYIKKQIIQYKLVIFIGYGLTFIYAFLNEIEKVQYVRFLSLLYFVLSILVFYLLAVSIADKGVFYRFMKFIGDYSFSSYMAHFIVINYWANKIMWELQTRNYLFVGILTLIITSVITPVIMMFISFLPFSEYITGTKYKTDSKVDSESSILETNTSRSV